MTAVFGLIIAGGQGQRLGGVRKGDLRWAGHPLSHHAALTLRDCTQPLLIGSDASRLRHVPPGAVLLPDPPGLHGPLGSLVAALDWLESHRIDDGTLVTTAVDTPLVPPDFLPRMTAALAEAQAAYAVWGENFYPTHAAFRLPGLRTAVDRFAPRSTRHLLAHLNAVAVEWSARAPEDPFLGLNTLDDLLVLGRRGAQGSFPQAGN